MINRTFTAIIATAIFLVGAAWIYELIRNDIALNQLAPDITDCNCVDTELVGLQTIHYNP